LKQILNAFEEIVDVFWTVCTKIASSQY